MNPTNAIGVVFALALLSACSEDRPTLASSSCCAEKLSTEALSGDSLYNLDSTWLDQEGKKRKLSEARGNVQVVAMIFTQCEYTCPRILADLKAIEAQLEPGVPVGFLLASFDTERDRPETLAAYARANHLSSKTWTLLHGSGPTVRELAAALGVQFEKSPGGGFSHSNLITVLDAEGEIVHQQEGLGRDHGPTLAAIRHGLSATR